MTLSRHLLTCGVAVALLSSLGANSASAALFWDQMSSASAANWGSNATADTAATFGFDYSTVGIPEAPNSMGGDVPTVGVKLEANLSSNTASQILLYPTGQNFTGEYKLSFDAWMNYDLQELILGDANGTTEYIGGGIGYDGLANNLTSGAQAIADGDGGSGSDYRVFKSPPQFFVPAADMFGGTRQNSDPYYADFLPGQAPPAAQGQPGALVGPPGTTGFQWLTWHFGVQDEAGEKIVRVSIEKPGGELLRLADINCSDMSDGSGGCTTDGNISLFYGDLFSGSSPRPDLTYGIIDNVHVQAIPEPASLALIAFGGIGMIAARRRRR